MKRTALAAVLAVVFAGVAGLAQAQSAPVAATPVAGNSELAQDTPSAEDVLRQQLADQAAQYRRMASSSRRSIEAGDHQMNTLRRQYADLSDRYNRLRADNDDLNRRLAEANQALEYADQQARLQKVSQSNTVEALGSAHDTRLQLQAQLDALAQQLGAERDRSNQLGAELATQRARNEDQRAENAALNARLATIAEINAKQSASLAAASLGKVAIGDRLSLPMEALFTSDNGGKPSSQLLPAGTQVTVVGMPRGASGLYAVTLDDGPTGWVSFR